MRFCVSFLSGGFKGMDSIVSFLSNPLLWKVIVGYWLFSSLVTALPKPNGNKLYQFIYAFLHGVAGNIDRAAQAFKVPGAQTVAQVLLIGIVLLALSAGQASAECGVERWPVKTLQDPEAKTIHFAPQDSTIVALSTPQPPPNLRRINPQLRLEQEKQVYRLHVLLMGFKVEADGDFHLVLADHDNQELTMVAEIPAPDCANDKYRQQFAQSAAVISAIHRPASVGRMVRLAQPVEVTVEGVFFFDFIHGQTGVAPNGAELHPVLRLTVGALISKKGS
jgi:hypothetical protein